MAYVKIANLKGEKGERGVQGPQGPAGTFAAAEAHSVDASEPASVVMSGSQTSRRADFYIPRGLPGVNAVDNDAAVATYLGAPDSATGAALRGALDSEHAVFGVVGVPGTLTIEKLQAAANEAASSGRTLQVGGTLTTDQTLTLACDFNLAQLTINYTGTGTAVQVGAPGATLLRRVMVLPKVWCQTNMTAGAWSTTPTVGVRLINLNTCLIVSTMIHFFDEGMVWEGNGGGFAYNEVHPGHLSGNRKNLILRGLTNGWANQNTCFGGRLSPNMTFGTVDDPEGRGLLLEDGVNVAPPNNNTFIGMSLESPNRDLYRLDVAGTHNYFLNCRWENPDPVGAPVRVRWRANATDNKIEEGFDLDKLVEVFVAGSSSNRIQLGTGVLYHRAWAVTAQAFPNGNVETPITSWSQLNQKGSVYNPTTGEITPRQGYWRFRAFVHVNALSGVAGFVQFGVRFNGVTQSVHRTMANSTQMQKLEVEFEGYFSGTDKLQYVFSQNTIGDVTLTTSSRFCQFRGDYLS